MDLKKKLKRFFTLTRKANDGFTLVELIVVIAILAILAGVGSVGYAGYIKAANKGADKTLVGNVMRAIETGTNSYAFVNGDSFKMGSMAFPVGFVTLDSDGIEVVQSGSTVNHNVTGNCVFGEIEIAYQKDMGKTTFTCDANSSHTKSIKVFNLVREKVTCCLTHSEFVEVTSDKTTARYEKYVCECAEKGYKTFAGIKLVIPAGTENYVEDIDAFMSRYGQSVASGMCGVAYADQNGSFDLKTPETVTSGAIYDSLVATFGEEQLAAMKLSYDGWASEEGTDFATFYLSAPELMGDMETLSGLLAVASYTSYGRDKLGLSQRYSDGADVLSGVSANITNTHTTEDGWLTEWNKAANQSWDSVGFGLTGIENYSAARMAYNNAFASYVDTMDSTIPDECINELKNFYSKSARDYGVAIDLGLPGCVNTSAFTDDNSGLKQAFIDAGDTTAGEKDSAFNKCAALYEKYKDSAACAENGKLVYNTLATFDQTSDVANAYADMYGGDIYDYYNNYVNEINALYEKAQEAAGDGIVIVVTVEKGLLNFQVSPDAANPRLD